MDHQWPLSDPSLWRTKTRPSCPPPPAAPPPNLWLLAPTAQLSSVINLCSLASYEKNSRVTTRLKETRELLGLYRVRSRVSAAPNNNDSDFSTTRPSSLWGSSEMIQTAKTGQIRRKASVWSRLTAGEVLDRPTTLSLWFPWTLKGLFLLDFDICK